MTIPNWMTISRLVLSPVFVIVFLQEGLWARIGALAIVAINEITDLFDGVVARRMGVTTDFGKIADPLADSVSRFTVFLCFLAVGYVQVWMVVLIFYRDIVVSYVRVLASMNGIVMGARRTGKFKAMAQAPSLVIICLLDVIRQMTPLPWFPQFTFWLISFVTVVTVISGIDYVMGTKHLLKGLKLK